MVRQGARDLNDRELPPVILQSALCAAPSVFLGFLAWFLFMALQLFDVEARALLPIPVLCLLPIPTFYFVRLCARTHLIRADASPLAASILIGLATALALYLMPTLDEMFPSHHSTQSGKSNEGLGPFIQVAIVWAGGWIGLRFFSKRPAAR